MIPKFYVLPPTAQRTLETLWQETHVHRFRDVLAGGDRHHFVFSLLKCHTLDEAHFGEQRIPGRAICLSPDHCFLDGHRHCLYAVAALRGAGRRRPREQGGGRRHSAHDLIAANLATATARIEMAGWVYFFVCACAVTRSIWIAVQLDLVSGGW